MQGLSFRLPLLALAALLAGAGAAPAEMIQWSYSSGADDVLGGSGADQGVGGPFFGLHFFPQRIDSLTNSATILLVRMEPFSLHGGPDDINRRLAFPFRDAPFTVGLGLRDDSSGAIGNLLFPGLVNGTVNNTALDNNVRLTFTGPTTQELVLGQNRYTVGLGSYVPPGPLDSGELGSLSAYVDVRSVSGTPEPSCLVLAGMGLVTVAAAAWRKRYGKIGATSETQLAA